MARKLFIAALLLAGLYAMGIGLWRLGNTAVFIFRAQKVPAVVVDATERPFESIFEMLEHGNMPWEGEIAYHPHLRYKLFGRTITDTTLPDLDNRDFSNGQQVELLVHPQSTHVRHINEAKFLWYGNLTMLGSGAFMLLLFRCLRRCRGKGEKRPVAESHVQAPGRQVSDSKEKPPTRKRSRKTDSREKPSGSTKRSAAPKKRRTPTKS